MLAGSIMTRGKFSDLFVSRLAYIDEIFYLNFNAPESVYNRVLNVRDSSRAYEEITGITGLAKFTEKGEAEKVEYDTLLQGFDKRFTHKTYAKGVQISMEAMDDDLDGAISNSAPALAQSAQRTIETLGADIFNEAFSTTNQTTPDGAALVSASHVLVAGGTFSNLISGDLSQSTLEQAINSYDDMRDDRNELIEGSPSILLYPPELRWLVHELLKSQLRSDTANNTANALTQVGLTPIMWKFLTDDDSCFVISQPSDHRLMFYWRMDPVSDHSMDFDTGNMKSKMTFRCSQGPAEWRNVVGIQGA